MISIINQSIEERRKIILEMQEIDATPGNLTKKQESRKATLLALNAALRDGATAEELRRWEKDLLLKEAGLPKLPEVGRLGRLDDETEQEYRNLGLGKPIRPSLIPKDSEVRANLAGQESISYTEGPLGGTLVAQGMYPRVLQTMKQYDQLFDESYSNVVETPNGAGMSFPVLDDINVNAVQVGETVQGSQAQIASFGTALLNAWSFRSVIVPVSLELLQDSNFNLGFVLERVFAMRFARGIGAKLATGSGSNTPMGLTTGALAAGASVIVATGSSANTGGVETGSTSIGTTDINSAFHKLDPAYRSGACWAMNDSTLSYLDSLLDKQGRPIVRFCDSVTGGPGNTPFIKGRPVAICPSMPSIAAGQNSVVFYNPQFFVQRRVPSSMFVRLQKDPAAYGATNFQQAVGYVEAGLVGFQAFMRVDSNFIAPNASYVPAVVIQQHS
jgi:HK97 family phage major capsid protein